MKKSFLAEVEKQLKYFEAKLSELKEILTDSLNIHGYSEDDSYLFRKNSIPEPIVQKSLVAQWKQLHINGFVFEDFSDVGFRAFSQNNEDGILLYIFTIIGTINKKFVEIGANCAESNIGIPENNTTNLVLNHGWNGLIVDGDKDNIGQLIHFFARCKESKHFHWVDRPSRLSWESNYFCPMLMHSLVTKENINTVISDAKLEGEIDLLSIDIDGMDYWIWKEISVISPRVVVVEFNNKISSESEYVTPYQSNYVFTPTSQGMWNYNGCSLRSLQLLGHEKGYRLVGVCSAGINAFFIRNDVAEQFFVEKSVAAIYSEPFFHIAEKTDFFQCG